MAFTIDDCVQKIRERLARTKENKAEATRALYPSLSRRLRASDKVTLMQEGLWYRVDDQTYRERHPGEGQIVQVRVPQSVPANLDPILVRLYVMTYSTPDGETRPFVRLTIADAAHLKSRNMAQMSGLIQINSWLDAVIVALKQHRAKDVGKLPVEAQKMLSEKWPG